MVHCVVVMDEYLKMVKKDIGIAHLSEDMIEEGLKVRDDSHENKRTDIKEQEQHSSRVHTARISVGACVAGGVHVRGWHASRGVACMVGGHVIGLYLRACVARIHTPSPCEQNHRQV